MRKLAAVLLVLSFAAVHSPAHANGNGVFVNIADDFWTSTVKTYYQKAGSYIVKPEKAAYACGSSGSYTLISKTSTRMGHCSTSARVKLVWKQVPDTGGYRPGTGVSWIDVIEEVNASDASHCDTGEAVIWDVGSNGAMTAYATIRDYCEPCAYSGGPCE